MTTGPMNPATANNSPVDPHQMVWDAWVRRVATVYATALAAGSSHELKAEIPPPKRPVVRRRGRSSNN